ncbi:MAG TPA: PAS domain S-box protein [Chloroflexota bacterium]
MHRRYRRVDQARLLAEATERLRRLEAVQRVSAAVNVADDLDGILANVLQEAMALVGAPSGQIAIVDADRQHVRGRVGLGLPPGLLETTVRQIYAVPHPREDMYARVIRTGEPLIFGPDHPGLHHPTVGAYGLEGLRGIVTPIAHASNSIGVLAMEWSSEHLPDETDLGMLRLVAEQAGSAIARARLVEAEQFQRRLLEQERAQLAESEARFRSAFQHSGSGMSLVELGGHFLQVNLALCRMLGYTEEELLATTFQAVTHPEDLAASVECIGRVLRGEEDHYTLEKRYLRKDGATISVLLNVSLVHDGEGQPLYFVSQFQDVTEWKELERRQVRDEKLRALGQLAAGVAHDVNNALAAIVGPAELLREAFARDGRASVTELDELDVILQAAEDASHTVRSLQSFARPANANDTLGRTPVGPDDLLADVVTLTRSRWREQASAEGRHIEVQVQPGGAPLVLADPAELREVLVNLVHNAADALPTGGLITIASAPGLTEAGAAQAIITVTDTGIGMDAATRRRVFEPFFTTKAVGKGNGLGLAMVHGIISRLGGTCDVTSELGVGTCVTLRLPATRPVDATPVPLISAAAPGRRVVLVEDEPALRDVAGRILTTAGHTVATFADAEAALAMLEQAGTDAFDVVVTDVGLPGMSGWRLVVELRLQQPGLPVIVATGWASRVDDEDLLRYGLSRDQLIAKPYRRSELQAVLDCILGTGATASAPDAAQEYTTMPASDGVAGRPGIEGAHARSPTR